MKNLLQQITKTTLILGSVAFLAACSCGDTKSNHHHHKKKHNRGSQQEIVMMEEMTEVVTSEVVEPNIMKAKMYTRSSKGGVTQMGFVKFFQTDNGVKMSVNVDYLRPKKDYTVKLVKCGVCNDDSCCAKQSMDMNLPTVMLEQQGILKQTFDVRGINWVDLNNAKVIFTRDGEYTAAWGRLHPVMNY